MGEAWSSNCKPYATLIVMKGRRWLQELVIVLRSQKHWNRFAFNVIGWKLMAERRKKRFESKKIWNKLVSMFVWDVWNWLFQTPLPSLATFDHLMLLMLPGIPNIFVCVLLFGCLRAPRLSQQYPGIPIWVVQTDAYCSSTPLCCCRHCSYNRTRQRMCLMSVPHSRGSWTRFDKYEYSAMSFKDIIIPVQVKFQNYHNFHNWNVPLFSL